jgi:hypothetical protein
MNEGRKLGLKVEDKATGFSKMLMVFYQNGHRQVPEDHILFFSPSELQFLVTEGTNEIKAG